MYVAVNERQREIGIHRAYGATRGVIAATFVLESAWLSLLGALVGLGLGFPASRYLGTINFPYEFDWNPMAALNMATSVLPGMKVSAEWQAAVAAAAHLAPSEAIAGPLAVRHRLRRMLTGLQVSVGVASVLLLTAIHEGIALEQLGGLARFSLTDTVVTDLAPTYSLQQMEPVAAPMKALARHPEQVRAIAEACPAFSSVEPQVSSMQPVKRGRYVISGVTGVSAGYLAADRMRLVEGRFFTEEEVRSQQRVAVMTDYATGMLNLDKAVGETVRIGRLPFQIVGVVAQGAEAMNSNDLGAVIMVPATSIPAAWTAGFPYIAGARLRAHLKSQSDYRAAERQFLTALARYLPKRTMEHLRLRGNLPDRYRLTNLRRASALRASVIGFSALLIALISLVNMLLVSVAEQTRAIGLRRALGATRASIASSVISEALLICLPGCVVGLGLGIVAAHFVGGWAHLSTAVPMFWISTSIGVALGVGLLASLIPAWRAAKVDPAVALRQE
jgi:putative ABC transport system permease protein